MTATDKIAHAAALTIVAGFCLAMFLALLYDDRGVPKEGYPLVTIALGYLCGFQVHRNGKKDDG